MSGKTCVKKDTKVPDDLRAAWEEIRLCGKLLREGRATIVKVTRKDGSVYRYTKPK